MRGLHDTFHDKKEGVRSVLINTTAGELKRPTVKFLPIFYKGVFENENTVSHVSATLDSSEN